MELIFVYNADSSTFAKLTDAVHKVVSPQTYSCNLCALTYGAFSMRDEWKKFIENLPLKAKFLHKDEFLKSFPKQEKEDFPCIFIKDNEDMKLLITSEEINRQKNLDDLKSLVGLAVDLCK
ncbi:MAG: hypothetical protein SGJ02_01735 [bacterium]|nr:hypothetical protein [bacterium]